MFERNKKVRGWIVRILGRAYPAGLEGDTIYKQLHELGYLVTRKEFDANMAYVMECGLVEVKKFGNLKYDGLLYNDDLLQNKIYKLTIEGVDLIERPQPDSGVDL